MVHKFVAIAAMSLFFLLGGCGTPGAPLPPSLNLPTPVKDLAATRMGDRVTLAWTMPRRNTDKLLLKKDIAVRICWREGNGKCVAVGGSLKFAPGTAGKFTERLPAPLTTGKPRALTYFVELKNRNGRSAGLSNAAVVAAGQTPGPVTDLTAELRKRGVLLRWKLEGTHALEARRMVIRLHRTLLTPRAGTNVRKKRSALAPAPKPVERNLLVEPVSAGAELPDRALDTSVHFGKSYQYEAQRVARIKVDGKTLELAGALSAPVRIEVRDIFPPATPTGLAAVATAEGSKAFIDLNWQPVVDTNLAGYIVYRREGDGPWQRISPAQPVTEPAFRDRAVVAGQTYQYRVSAISHAGHESAPSAEAGETVPTP